MEVDLRTPMVDEDEELLSECSSGCESGWTVYLNELEGGPWEEEDEDAVCSKRRREDDSQEEDDDEDGMSTVSDASSGPPTLHGMEGSSSCCCCSACNCYSSSPYGSTSSCSSPAAALEKEREQTRKRARVDEQQEQHLPLCRKSLQDYLLEDTATSAVLPRCHAQQQLAHVSQPLSNAIVPAPTGVPFASTLDDEQLLLQDTRLIGTTCNTFSAAKITQFKQRRLSPEEHHPLNSILHPS